MKKITIVGGGIAGMFCAYLLAQKNEYEITLLERGGFLGGGYTSYKTPEEYIFDIGIHILYSTSIKEIDDIFFDILPKDQWNILRDNLKDIAGVFFNQSLQLYSHYPDLTNFPILDLSKYISDFYLNLSNNPSNDPRSAKDIFIAKFGNEISQNIITPLLENLWGKPLDEMDPLVVRINSLDRVILHNKNVMDDLIKAPNLASRLAYPDQLNLPPIRNSKQFALYPKKFGMKTFSDAFTNKLLKMGVNIEFKSFVESMKIQDGKLVGININSSGKNISRKIDGLIWCGGLNALASQLEVPREINKPPEFKEVVLLNYLFDFEPNMPEIYYFYCYDLGYGSFRVTNYSNFCKEASATGLYPITIEFWPSKLNCNQSNEISKSLVEIGFEELVQFGVIPSGTKPVYQYMHETRLKFPVPSVMNRVAMQEVSGAINGLAIDNIHVTGISSKHDIFFSNQVIEQAYELIQSKF